MNLGKGAITTSRNNSTRCSFPQDPMLSPFQSAGSRSGSGDAGSRRAPKYVYELPYFERRELCRILDENNQWEALGGGLMCFSPTELSEFGRAVYRGASPTDSLFTAWGSQNHTILELFTLLGRLGHFRGMKVIKDFVPQKYHIYIKEHEVDVAADLVQQDVQGFAKSIHPLDNSPNGADDKNANLPPQNPKTNVAESIGSLPPIPFVDLQLATENWERRNIIGKGGFGTVYKGMWKNTPVAIKRMEQRANQTFIQSQLRQSLGELRFLNAYRHDNVLPIYGYCLEGEYPCLVYQYMSNGSLEDRLLCRNRTYPLNWTLRYNIARSVACGIQFLHSIGPKPLIHGDIKSANILLDKNFEAKVGDFGLAREINQTAADASYVKVSRVHGTRPYLPDEYLRSKKLSTKVDTFSFGIMLYEIISGQRAYEESRPKKLLRDMFDESENVETLKDPKGGSENPDIFWILLRVAKSCTLRLAKERPEMVQVLKSVEGLMSQASIRTSNSHMTGLPQLFEQTMSLRPGTFIPSGHSANPRLSPVDMRSPIMQRMTPQSSVNQTPKFLESSGIPGGSHRLSPAFPNLLSHTPTEIRSPVVQPEVVKPAASNGVAVDGSTTPRGDTQQVNAEPAVLDPVALLRDLHSDTKAEPEVQLQHPSVSPVLGPVQDDFDNYFPVFLDDSRGEMSEETTEGAATVIPLITALGIKD